MNLIEVEVLGTITIREFKCSSALRRPCTWRLPNARRRRLSANDCELHCFRATATAPRRDAHVSSRGFPLGCPNVGRPCDASLASGPSVLPNSDIPNMPAYYSQAFSQRRLQPMLFLCALFLLLYKYCVPNAPIATLLLYVGLRSPAVVRSWWDPPESKYGVIVFVTTEHKWFRFIVNDTMRKVPQDWPITVYYPHDIEEFVVNNTQPWLRSGKVWLWRHNVTQLDNTTYAERELAQRLADTLNLDNHHKELYGLHRSHYLYSPRWWEALPYEKALFMQMDTIICRRNLKALFKFTRYDYIGAPWEEPPEFTNKRGGNGGFSWRSKNVSLSVLARESLPAVSEGFEDYYYSRHIPEDRIAPRNVSCAFGAETIQCHEAPFGVHNAWSHIKGEAFETLEKSCPGMKVRLGKITCTTCSFHDALAHNALHTSHVFVFHCRNYEINSGDDCSMHCIIQRIDLARHRL